MADLLVRGGSIIDGRGTPPRRADLRIRDGRVSEIGEDLKPGGEGEGELEAEDR
jgi:N-acyl-D-amino-acid deacylase